MSHFILIGGTFAAESAPPSFGQSLLNGMQQSFTFPVEQLYHKPYDSEWRNLLNGLSVKVAYAYPLDKTAPIESSSLGNNKQGVPVTNDILSANLKYTPLSYWFFSLNGFVYLHPELQKDWDPDWSYSFGYDDWHPYTWSLVYSNSGGNAKIGKRPQFNEGVWSLGTKFPLPQPLHDWVVTGLGDSIGCSFNMSFVAFNDKFTASAGCKYNFFAGLYVNYAVYYYPQADKQEAWNPDYTYGFGLVGWKSQSISLQYSNSSGNRFSSKNRTAGTGQFNNGSLTVAWSHAW